jgi:hypothetical protein
VSCLTRVDDVPRLQQDQQLYTSSSGLRLSVRCLSSTLSRASWYFSCGFLLKLIGISGEEGFKELPYSESWVSACFRLELFTGTILFFVIGRLVGIVLKREKDGISVRRSRLPLGRTEEPLADLCASRLPHGARSATWARKLAGTSCGLALVVVGLWLHRYLLVYRCED